MDPVHKLIWQKCFDLGGSAATSRVLCFFLTRFHYVRVSSPITPLCSADLFKPRKKIRTWKSGVACGGKTSFAHLSLKLLKFEPSFTCFYLIVHELQFSQESSATLTLDPQFLAQLKTLTALRGGWCFLIDLMSHKLLQACNPSQMLSRSHRHTPRLSGGGVSWGGIMYLPANHFNRKEMGTSGASGVQWSTKETRAEMMPLGGNCGVTMWGHDVKTSSRFPPLCWADKLPLTGVNLPFKG